MSFPLLIAFLSILSFGCLTIYYAVRADKTRRKLQAIEEELTRKDSEENLLEEIHAVLDYSLDTEKITAVFTKHVTLRFPCTTISSLLVSEQKLTFTVYAAQPVPHSYINDVKESMLDSIATMEKKSFRDTMITEEITGTITKDSAKPIIASSINFPLMIHHSVAAIITVTSTQPHAFPKEEVASLQNVLKHVAKSLSRFDGALQIEKSRLKATIESLTDGIFMVDTESKLQIINPAAKLLLSLHKEPLTTMDVLSALPVSYDFKDKIDVAMKHNQGMELRDIIMKNKLLTFTVTPIRASTGNVMGVAVLMRDNTLKHSVPRMKEDFTNIIVHELRNPLTSIKASSELLISPTEFSKEEQRKLIQLIYQQSNKLLSEVQQILDAAKLEAGVFTIHKNPGDLKELIKEVTTLFQPEMQQKMINFVIDVDPHLPNFSFDSVHLNEALSNVLSNSLKFTSTAGTIQLSLKQKNGDVVITVADTGVGIPKDKQNLLFNRFSQISDASARVGKGLGLYLVKGIMDAHGGTVEIDSDTGRGTTIFLTLPLTDATHMSVSDAKQSSVQKMVN